MREPQVVRTPCVQKMSLCAIGTPVSGAAVACRERRSACAAAASACSPVTVDEGVERARGSPRCAPRQAPHQLDAREAPRAQPGCELRRRL